MIHFDDVTDGTLLANAEGDSFDVTFGASQNQTLTVTEGADNVGSKNDWLVEENPDGRTPISGDEGGSNALGGSTTYDFRFSTGLTDVGITVLSRGDTDDYNSDGHDVTTTLLFDDGSSTEVDTEVNVSKSDDDTLFAYSTEGGKLITGFQVTTASAGSESDYTSLDDLAFVTIPEPASFLLLALGGLALLRRPRRW